MWAKSGHQTKLLPLVRHYVSKSKKTALLQNVDVIPETKMHIPSPKDHRVYAWGLAETGALGIHTKLQRSKGVQASIIHHPSRIQFAEKFDVKQVICGYGFSLFVTSPSQDDVTLFGTGLNLDSQLGVQWNPHRRLVEELIYPAPVQIFQPGAGQKRVAVKTAAAGRAHALILSEDGEVFPLGNNAYGQCGRPVVEDEEYFGHTVEHWIGDLDGEKVAAVAAGQDHSVFITPTGRVFTCGWGADGQTGLETFETVMAPREARGDIKGECVVKVAAKSDCNLALNDKGEVFGWGNSEYGQLGFAEQPQVNVPRHLEISRGLGRIVDVAAGGSFCMLLNENGDVFVWGYGLLGLGPSVDMERRPRQIPPTLFGRNEFNPNHRVVALECGLSHMAAVDEQGDLFMWGRNKYGCLGFGHEKDQFFPFKTSMAARVVQVSCGPDHTLALCKSYLS